MSECARPSREVPPPPFPPAPCAQAGAAVEVDDEAFAKCEALMERLLELDDVEAVYTNCDGLVI